MLKQKTVFVIGAGASREYGLPVGADLANEISEKVDVRFERGGHQVSGDVDLYSQVKMGGKGKEYQQAGWVIRDGIILANSIDDFLHVHREDTFITSFGKAAIVKCILEAEARSSLKLIREINPNGAFEALLSFRSCENTWLVKLMRLLFRTTSKSDPAKVFDRCSFIIFNYDRCVEHFFAYALMRAYNIKFEEAAKIVSKANIVHPYGAVGEMHTENSVPFGHNRVDWFRLGESIKTYTEAVDDARIKKLVSDAATVVFLGFAYHDQNMALLADHEKFRGKTFIGTAYEMSENDIRVTKQQLTGWIDPKFQILAGSSMFMENTTAEKLLTAYQKSL